MLNQEDLKKYLHYNPESGVFVWRVNKPRVIAGDVAGFTNADGYIVIKLDGIAYMAHRLAFLYMTGRFPEYEADHDDRVRDNNRWLNLNSATRQDNNKNKSPRKDNSSGVTGVNYMKSLGKWQACIGVNKKWVYLGCYRHISDAIIARKMAEYEHGYHENHGDPSERIYD